MLIDSHCHLDRLDLTAFDGSLDAVLDSARARGVRHFLCIGISTENAATVRAFTERYADVDCSVGVHPLDLVRGGEPTLDWLLEELEHPGVVAVGETEPVLLRMQEIEHLLEQLLERWAELES